MNLKEENEKLREILRRVHNYVPIPDQIRIDSALSQQAEPSTVVAPFDLNEFARRAGQMMAEHDFHGFEPIVLAIAEELLGVQAETVPAQDEREARINEMVRIVEAVTGRTCFSDKEIAIFEALATRPAQTEQKPVGVVTGESFDALGDGWHPAVKFSVKTLPKGTKIYAAPIAQKYDDVLLPFLSMMRAELHANAGKGDRPGWLAMDVKTALLEIFYHIGKLQKAAKKGDRDGIREYSADVANMSMMLADICGVLPGYQAQTAPQPEQSGLVEALEEIASGLQAEFAWEVAEQALAAYRAALAAQQTNKI